MKRLSLLTAAFLFVVMLAGCKRKAAPVTSPAAVAKTTATPTPAAPVAVAEKSNDDVFVINGATLIAFFPATQAEIDKDANGPDEISEALGDFQDYLFSMTPPMRDAGISVEWCGDPKFEVRVDGKVIHVDAKATGPNGYGYYYIAPGKTPHIETEMMDDEGFKDAAKKYFGITVGDPKADDAGAAKDDTQNDK